MRNFKHEALKAALNVPKQPPKNKPVKPASNFALRYEFKSPLAKALEFLAARNVRVFSVMQIAQGKAAIEIEYGITAFTLPNQEPYGIRSGEKGKLVRYHADLFGVTIIWDQHPRRRFAS